MTPEERCEVLIVSGFGRCGSSLMMQMLQAGGFPCVGEWPAFEDPESMALNLHSAWLRRQAGKAVKVLDPQLAGDDLFPHISRRVIWLDRDPKQQAKSFVKFGRVVSGLPFNRSHVSEMSKGFLRDRPLAHRALRTNDCKTLRVTFENMIKDPLAVATAVHVFLGFSSFDPVRAAGAVRKRSANCLPYLLEAEMVEEIA